MDFDSLSNQEIYKAFTDRGVTVGGVNASTRNLYIKKLKKLIAEENGDGDLDASVDQNQTNGGYTNGVNEEEVHEEPVVKKIIQQVTESVKRRTRKETTPPQEDHINGEPVVANIYPKLTETVKKRTSKKEPNPFDDAEDSDYGEESSRILTDEEMRNVRDMSYSRRSPVQNGSSWFISILKALAIVLVAVFLYFVLESTSKNTGNRESL